MDPEHRALLRTHRLYLSGQLLVTDTIVPFLFQEHVLTEAHVEDIEAQPSDTLRCRRLLDLLPVRGPRAFGCFLRSLEDFGWVRDKLLLELQARPGTGPSAAGENTSRRNVY
ncbi:death domain-containing protein CRADD [Anarrhichthys ocellatus]|uniref:death domain-containing protein CRADD n=1 Tax=Anarrhichthys ocellatus TaxID=433405 RepID=UPI0012EDBFFE|nr:death domain-containing protein CRADD-like [Anarrhichthys ocellatus]